MFTFQTLLLCQWKAVHVHRSSLLKAERFIFQKDHDNYSSKAVLCSVLAIFLALKGGQILSWQGCRMNCPPLLPLCMGMVPHALGLNFRVFLLQELFIQILQFYALLGPKINTSKLKFDLDPHF